MFEPWQYVKASQKSVHTNLRNDSRPKPTNVVCSKETKAKSEHEKMVLGDLYGFERK